MYFSCPTIRLQKFIQVSQVKGDINIIMMSLIIDDKMQTFTFDLMMNPPSEHWFGLAAVLFILKIKPNHQHCFFPLRDPGNEPLSASSWRDLDFCTSLSGESRPRTAAFWPECAERWKPVMVSFAPPRLLYRSIYRKRMTPLLFSPAFPLNYIYTTLSEAN